MNARRALRGYRHPASAQDVRDALRAFGPTMYYGVKSIELRHAPEGAAALTFGRLVAPGRIELYEQPVSPWRIRGRLRAADEARFRAAGAVVDQDRITWPDDSLRAFMIGWVLAHELGHHVQQHEKRLKSERAARSRDHELRADSISSSLRSRRA